MAISEALRLTFCDELYVLLKWKDYFCNERFNILFNHKVRKIAVTVIKRRKANMLDEAVLKVVSILSTSRDYIHYACSRQLASILSEKLGISPNRSFI